MKHQSQITRRTLLKQAAAAGVGAVALPQIVPSSVFGADAPSKKLNIGILACGGQARGNMRACMGSENIVAICDVDQRQVAEAKKDLAKRRWPTRPRSTRTTASCWTRRSRSTRW